MGIGGPLFLDKSIYQLYQDGFEESNQSKSELCKPCLMVAALSPLFSLTGTPAFAIRAPGGARVKEPLHLASEQKCIQNADYD